MTSAAWRKLKPPWNCTRYVAPKRGRRSRKRLEHSLGDLLAHLGWCHPGSPLLNGCADTGIYR